MQKFGVYIAVSLVKDEGASNQNKRRGALTRQRGDSWRLQRQLSARHEATELTDRS